MSLEYARPVAPFKPGVVTWFMVYSLLMALLYLIVLVAGVILLANARDDEMYIQGILLAAISLPLLAAFAAAPFLPRRPWVWIFDIVMICIGLTSVCTMPASIPLLIFWLKPETKVWFGKN